MSVIAAGLRDAERKVGAEESSRGEGPGGREAKAASTAKTADSALNP